MGSAAKSPLALQGLLGDIGQRRALALALRAQELGPGQMVSGKYVPNLRGVGGALSRGLFGDPVDEIRQEEAGAFAGYEQELGNAMSGLANEGRGLSDADFGQRVAAAQTAGVPQSVIERALKRRPSVQMFDRMISSLSPSGAPNAGGRAAPVGGGMGAPPGAGTAMPQGAPMPTPLGPPSGGMPARQGPQAPQGGVLQQLFSERGSGGPLSHVPTGMLMTAAATMEPDMPEARLVDAELKARRVEQKDGIFTRNGQPFAMREGGSIVDLTNGQAIDLTGAIEAQRAGGKAEAEARARAPYQPQQVRRGDETVTTFLRPEGGGFVDDRPRPAAGAPGGGKIKVNFEGSPEEVRQMVERAITEANGAGARAVAGGGEYPLGVGMGDVERKRQETEVETRGKSAQAINADFMSGAYRPALEAGNAARATISQIDALQKLNLNSGWGSDVQAYGARVLSGLGVAPADAKGYAANAETFRAVASQQVLQVLAAQKGPQTERDANRIESSFVQLKNTPEANKFILDLTRAAEQQKIDKAAFYRNALPGAQQAGDLSRVEAAWAERQQSIFDYPWMKRWGELSAPAARNPDVEAALQKYAPKVR